MPHEHDGTLPLLCRDLSFCPVACPVPAMSCHVSMTKHRPCCADFIVDFTQVTALSASVFNVVLVRDPYASVNVGDITAVRAQHPDLLPLPANI